MPISVLLADDHTIFRESLRVLFERQSDFQVVGEAADGRQAVELAERLRPNVIVLDLAMPGLSGLDAIRYIKNLHATIRVVVLSAYDQETFMADAFRLGADAYVLKEQSLLELVQAVRAALAGERYISSGRRASAEGTEQPQASGPADDTLTLRERQVLDLTVKGLSNAEIGAQLGVSARTVETHRAHLMLKLGLKSRRDLTHIPDDQEPD